MRARILGLLLSCCLPAMAGADAVPGDTPTSLTNTPLHALLTGDETRGWEAVGRINLDNTGFCTGALIAPDLVLTAAHCLYDQETGLPYPAGKIQFLAGWRNGRADAYRGVRRTMAHPDYDYNAENKMSRVAYDVALLQLDRPIRLPSIRPFDIAPDPMEGDPVTVVSYGLDRSEAPSKQDTCHVLGRQPGFIVTDCNVEFGSSGAPIFAIHDGVPQIASVVSAKSDMDGQPVSLATAMEVPLTELRAAFDAQSPRTTIVSTGGQPRLLSTSNTAAGASGGNGAKFLKP